MDKQIQALKNLGLSDAEIADVLEADRQIEKGAKLFELPDELKAGAKKARLAGNCSGYHKTPKPIDEDKGNLIKLLAETVAKNAQAEDVKITNPAREILFTANGKQYKIVLSCPRKPQT